MKFNRNPLRYIKTEVCPIFWYRLYYIDHGFSCGCKIRPIVILGRTDRKYVYACPITTCYERKPDFFRVDYLPITNLKIAGLKRQSYIDVSKIYYNIRLKNLYQHAGHLSVIDCMGMMNSVEQIGRAGHVIDDLHIRHVRKMTIRAVSRLISSIKDIAAERI